MAYLTGLISLVIGIVFIAAAQASPDFTISRVIIRLAGGMLIGYCYHILWLAI